jgi:hypothetical protein
MIPMTTLISVGNSSGETRRCDAKCYNGHGKTCDCVCGGVNHGKGFNIAAQQVTERFEEMFKTFKENHPEFIESREFALLQLPLEGKEYIRSGVTGFHPPAAPADPGSTDGQNPPTNY